MIGYVIHQIYAKFEELIFWELTFWEVDILRVDILGVDILGRTLLSHHNQEASFIYVNNVGPWNYDLGYHGAEGPA